MEEGEIDEEEDEHEDPPASFDLFSSTSPKKDWDDHPDMDKLMETGMTRMEKVGFSSPKPESQHVTMYDLARQHKVKLPKKRDDAVPILVRALAIVRIKQLDKTAVEKYTDLKLKDSPLWYYPYDDHGINIYIKPPTKNDTGLSFKSRDQVGIAIYIHAKKGLVTLRQSLVLD